MANIYKIRTILFIDAEDDLTVEELGKRLAQGLEDSISNEYNLSFDDSQVLGVAVEQIDIAKDQELVDAGIIEDTEGKGE